MYVFFVYRDQLLSKLQAKDEEFDVLVIGGGATGCGVALDAQTRGISLQFLVGMEGHIGILGTKTANNNNKLTPKSNSLMVKIFCKHSFTNLDQTYLFQKSINCI